MSYKGELMCRSNEDVWQLCWTLENILLDLEIITCDEYDELFIKDSHGSRYEYIR